MARDDETEQPHVPPVAFKAAGIFDGMAARPNTAAKRGKKSVCAVASSLSRYGGRTVGGGGASVAVEGDQ